MSHQRFAPDPRRVWRCIPVAVHAARQLRRRHLWIACIMQNHAGCSPGGGAWWSSDGTSLVCVGELGPHGDARSPVCGDVGRRVSWAVAGARRCVARTRTPRVDARVWVLTLVTRVLTNTAL